MSIAWQSASVVGPVVAGILIGHGWNVSYIAMLVVGCVVVAWLALVAERRIPARVNGVRDVEPAVPEAPWCPVRRERRPRGRLDWTTAPRVVVPH